MKQIFIYLFLSLKVVGQSYSINVFGFHACDVDQIISSPDKIEFKTQNRGVFDLIWPTNNYYKTIFDPKNFALKQSDSLLSFTQNYKKNSNKIFATSSNKKIGITNIQKETLKIYF